MSIANSSSLKEFALQLISGEIGFIGAQAPNPRMVYEDYITVLEAIAKRVKQKNYENLNFNFYCLLREEIIEFDVDYDFDWRSFFALYSKIKMTNELCGSEGQGIGDIAVGLNIDSIYEHIGDIVNENDDYFQIIKELWVSFKMKNPSEEEIERKIKSLKHSFILSEKRINELKA